MQEGRSSYRQIFKSTSFFGGVQIIKIVLSVIRTKLIAILLGPAGMGITGLLTSTIDIVSRLTSFGLSTSAVKSISAANVTNDIDVISRKIVVFRRLMWLTGLLGFLITLLMSPLLSVLTFNNYDYTFSFVCLSIILLLTQLSDGQNVLLQGMRKLQYLAKANVAGAFAGLVITIPIYYYWNLQGIVPALILSSCLNLFFAWLYGKKIPVKKIIINLKLVISESKEMMQMGIMLSLSGLVTTGASYVLAIYINRYGGSDELGLYNAGFAIISTYVGLVFSAMGTDYFPRLSGVANNNKDAAELINHQAEAAVLILAPILILFLIFIDDIISLLYTSKFHKIDAMLYWAAMGVYFKAVSWSIAFIIIVKGDSKIFFMNELVASIYTLVINLLGYRIGGLEGMGISFLIGYFIYMLQVYMVARMRYEFFFTKKFYEVMAFQLLMALISFFAVKYYFSQWMFYMSLLLLSFSAIYSIIEIDKRVNILSYLKIFKKM